MTKSNLLFLLAILISCMQASAQDFKIMPLQPEPGVKIDIEYNATGGPLEDLNINTIVYVLEHGEVPAAFDIDMTSAMDKHSLKGSFQIPKNADGIFVKFENEDGRKSDNNHDEGYYSVLYKDGKPLENAYASVSDIYSNYAGLLGVKRDASKAAIFFDLAVGEDETKRMHLNHINQFASLASATKNELEKELIINHIKKEIAKSGLDEKDLIKLANVARILKDQDLNKEITDKAKADFPDGSTAGLEKFSAFRSLQSLDDKIAMFNDLNKQYGGQKDYENSLTYMVRTIATEYGKKGDFKNMEEYVSMIPDNMSKAGIYNNLAWTFSGESIEGEASFVEESANISKKSLMLIEEEMASMKGKQAAYSAKQWKRNLNFSHAMYSDTYALLAYKLGDVKSATKYQAIACKQNDMSDANMNERYAIYLEKDQGAKNTMAYLEEMIEQGNSTAAMKSQFTKLFKANMTLDEASDMYLAKLEKKAEQIKIERIKVEMIHEKAPAFSLTNLKGEQVSLESLKGKVVVVDFWATWCGPCIASFPGMQKAVTKYSNAEDIAFVFVDTWESAKNKVENAQKFIDDKGYTFNVLMDTNDKMVSDYGVSGIPTKFILDKEGNIRFKSTGFNGSDDALIDEISIVVEILRGKSTGTDKA